MCENRRLDYHASAKRQCATTHTSLLHHRPGGTVPGMIFRMKKLPLLVLVTMLSAGLETRAEISVEKRKEVERMLRLTGMEKLTEQIKTQMISGLKAQMKQVPETFWTKFQQKLDTRELLEKIIPLYDKYYTIEDLKAVNAFYESPTGQKVLSTLPQIMQESMKIGQEWGEKVGRQAAEEVEQELKTK
jgi:uncharacterized protein